ncbi:hypothetical protein POTOM_054652 [Populus tomentosa]|uniref:Peroxisome biogenesis protein 22 n=1 Tax=Populus tomentosa TaxID=118781 RepID=A0A8X8C6J2_POPTO|nr:hypothetical protein POTOM_054652 [Populus tomentosa]
MATETSKDELLQLVKRFSAYLTVKMSNLFSFNTPDSRSVGAVAGLAVAIVFTWRWLRSNSGPQRRQPKRQASTTSSSVVTTQPNAVSIPSGGVCSSSEDLRVQNVVDEFFQTVTPSLGQIVRQKLSEGRKVTCRLLGVILEESSPEELQGQSQATVRSSVLEVLLEITKFCDVYLMERVLDDESEQKVLAALENAGVFTSGGLVKDKVLFCSTETGRSSFVRQLEPDWHIDTNPEVIFQLAVRFLHRFIKYQLHISPIRPERTAANVLTSHLRATSASCWSSDEGLLCHVILHTISSSKLCEVNISWDSESFLTGKVGKWKEFSSCCKFPRLTSLRWLLHLYGGICDNCSSESRKGNLPLNYSILFPLLAIGYAM